MTAIKEKATLGQPITFTAILKRVSSRVDVFTNDEKKEWKPRPCIERKGIVVGTRTLWDGTLYYESDGQDGLLSYFTFGNHVPALLVAYALNRKPVLVPLDNAVAAV